MVTSPYTILATANILKSGNAGSAGRSTLSKLPELWSTTHNFSPQQHLSAYRVPPTRMAKRPPGRGAEGTADGLHPGTAVFYTRTAPCPVVKLRHWPHALAGRTGSGRAAQVIQIGVALCGAGRRRRRCRVPGRYNDSNAGSQPPAPPPPAQSQMLVSSAAGLRWSWHGQRRSRAIIDRQIQPRPAIIDRQKGPSILAC